MKIAPIISKLRFTRKVKPNLVDFRTKDEFGFAPLLPGVAPFVNLRTMVKFNFVFNSLVPDVLERVFINPGIGVVERTSV